MNLKTTIAIAFTALASISLYAEAPQTGRETPTYFPKGKNPVTYIYQVNITDLKYPEDMITLQALQGIVAKYSNAQLYLCATEDHYGDYWYAPTDADRKKGLDTADKFWLNYLTTIKEPAIKYSQIDLAEAVKEFRQYIKGYVLYKNTKDSGDNDNDELNIAVSCAGVNDCIPLTQKQVEGYGAFGLDEMINAGSYNKSYSEFYNKNESLLCKNMLFELNPNLHKDKDPVSYRNMPRDYATMNNAMICYSDDISQDLNFMSSAIPFSVIGWGHQDEKIFVSGVSSKGGVVLPNDWGQNLSLLSSSTSAPVQANTTPMAQIKFDPKKKYATFIISDGDNLQLYLNTANDVRWWGNPIRTSKPYPVGWTACPAMYYIAPDAWNYYVQTAVNNGKSNDEFICGPSGIGYNYGNVADTGSFGQQLSDMDAFMRNSNISVLTIFGYDDWENNNDKWLGGLVGQKSVQGAFYFGYPQWPPIGPSSGEGVRFYRNSERGEDVPIMYVNAFLKDEFTEAPTSSSSSSEIEDTIARINGSKKTFPFTAVYVCKNFNGIWNVYDNKDKVGVYVMDDIDIVVNKLNKDVVVVSPSQMISLLKQWKAQKKK